MEAIAALKSAAETKGNVKVTREDWLDLAAEVLVEHGVSQVKVLALANRLGVSRSSFYWYFRSRKDLLDQLLAQWEGQNTRAILTHAAFNATESAVKGVVPPLAEGGTATILYGLGVLAVAVLLPLVWRPAVAPGEPTAP